MDKSSPRKRPRGSASEDTAEPSTADHNRGNSHSVTEPRGAINAALSEKRRELLNSELQVPGLPLCAAAYTLHPVYLPECSTPFTVLS